MSTSVMPRGQVAHVGPSTPEILRGRGTRPRSNALSARRLSVPNLTLSSSNATHAQHSFEEPSTSKPESSTAHVCPSLQSRIARRDTVTFNGWRSPDSNSCDDTSDMRYVVTNINWHHPGGGAQSDSSSEASYSWGVPDQTSESDVCMMDLDQVEPSTYVKLEQWNVDNADSEALHVTSWQGMARFPRHEVEELALDYPMDED